MKLCRDRAISIGMLCAEQDQPHGQLPLQCPGICLPMEVLPVPLPRAGTPAAPVAWLLCCAVGVKQGGSHLWVLPSNSLVPSAKPGRHNSSFIVWGMNLFSSVKKYSLQICAAYWASCWLDVQVEENSEGPEKQSSHFVSVFYLV